MPAAPFPEYLNGKLYVFDNSSGPSFCEWLPVSPAYPGEKETLIKRSLIEPGWDHSYEFFLEISNGTDSWEWQAGPYRWNDPDDCNLTIVGAGCEFHEYHLVNPVFPRPDANMVSQPLYICTDEQSQAWPVS